MEDTRQRLRRELESIKREPKEQRLAWYFDMFKLPSQQQLDSEEVRDALGLTELDSREYQVQKEKEVSMPSAEKRKRILKEVVKPLLKEAGFRTKGQEWWRELTDGWLLIHLKNSQFNSPVTGCRFEFDISASSKEEIKEDITKQWIYNQFNDLSHCCFLPYAGMLSPYCEAYAYNIDGYQNYLPKDDPLENILKQVYTDFADHILPQLAGVQSISDWKRLYEERRTYLQRRELVILRFYHSVCMGSGISSLQWEQKEHALTTEEALSHLDWLETIGRYSSSPNEDWVSRMKVILRNINTEGQE